MVNFLNSIFSDKSGSLRQKISGIYSLLILFNLVVWGLAFFTLQGSPWLFSTAVLAYTFGLRHAVDADHIAAIDNVTRKLMQEGKQPAAAGLFFSLGHSSVVILATAGIALTTKAILQNKVTQLHDLGSVLGTSISALFLILIAIMNLLIFRSIYHVFKQVRLGKPYQEEDIDQMMSQSGFLVRRFRRIFKLISHSWQMYPLGFLFGIGFDTATEVLLLGLAASQTADGMSLWTVLIFPALFTAGMTLIDTTDGIIMLGAYGWAFLKPVRKLYYNLTITFISVLIALFVGTIETFGLISNKLEIRGWVWDLIHELNDHSNIVGYVIIAIFIVSWLSSMMIYKWMKFDEMDQNQASQERLTKP
jgi:high-affinity nickel-transport protein